jgi:hypothetical protein
LAWSTPATAVANTQLPAATWNLSVRDNMNTLAPAIADLPNELVIRQSSSSGTVRSITTNGGVATDTIATLESTTSTSYTNLTTVGPQVTVNSPSGWVFVVAYVNTQTTVTATGGTDGSGMSYELDGPVTSIAASDTWATMTSQPVAAPSENTQFRTTSARLHAVTANEDVVITCKYRTTSGTGYYSNRYLLALPL